MKAIFDIGANKGQNLSYFLDKDDYNTYLTLKVFNRILH